MDGTHMVLTMSISEESANEVLHMVARVAWQPCQRSTNAQLPQFTLKTYRL